MKTKLSRQSRTHSFCPIEGFLDKDSVKKATHCEIDFEKLSPCLRTLLVTDGTVTKVLESYFWEPISVKPLLQEECTLSSSTDDLSANYGDRALRRFVKIEGITSGRLYVLGESYLLVDRLEEDLRNELLVGRLGIGGLLRDRKWETHRSMLRYYLETAGDLAHETNLPDDEQFLSRDYTVSHRGKPVILIKEKFPTKTYKEL